MQAPIAFPIAGAGFLRTVPERQPVRTPAWRLVIDGRDITREITTYVTSVRYTDHAHGKSDDVEVTLADPDQRFRNSWYPTKGDVLELWIGYDGDPLLPCGRFDLDELEFAGKPDTVSIKALATGVIPDLRTKRSKGFEGQTLPQIVRTVADRHKLTVVGTIAPIAIERMTQRNEDDLTFLTRIADRYGYVFSVRGPQLVFHEVAELLDAPPTVTLRPDRVNTYRLKDKNLAVYRACELTYHDPKTNTEIHRTVKAKGVTDGDVLKLDDVRAESIEQAEAQARAALVDANRKRAKGTVAIEGEPRLVAGTTLQLAGWGKLDTTYPVTKSTHRLTRADGYTTTLDLDGGGSDEDDVEEDGF